MNIEVIFKWVLIMIIGGSIVVLIFVILSKIFKENLSVRVKYYIWMVGFFCFIILWNVLVKLGMKDIKILN